MKLPQSFSSFVKNPFVKIPLIVIGTFLQLVGIVALIGAYSYHVRPKDGTFGPWQYSYELSEKAALDTWEKNSRVLKADPEGSANRTFGEFRAWVDLSKDENGKEIVRTLFGGGEYAIGSLYLNGKKFSAQLYPQTGEVVYDASASLERPNWHWYDWMGLRPPQWYLDYANLF